MHDQECQDIDDWIVSHKSVVGFLPPWGKQFRRQFQTRWGIADHHGIESAELCLTFNRDGRHGSIVGVHRQRLIYRLDIAPDTECKDNFHTAWRQGLPHNVCGSHVHGWPENREYVIYNGFGELPVRRPIAGAVIGLIDALHWVAQDLQIQVGPGQRDIELPDFEMM